MSAVHPTEAPLAEEVRPRALPVAATTIRPPRLFFRVALVTGDAAMLLCATSIASLVWFGTLFGQVHVDGAVESSALLLCVEVVAVWMPLLFLGGLYAPAQSWGSGEFSHAVRAILLGAAGYLLLRFVLGLPVLPREWVVLSWALATGLVVSERLILRAVASRLHARGRLLNRTLVVGTNSEAASVVHALLSRHLDGFAPVGCLASSLKDRLSLDYTAPVLPTLGAARDLLRVVFEHEIDVVVVVASAFDHEVLERIIAELSEAHVEVYLSTSLSDVLTARVSVREVAGIPLISLRGISLSPLNLFVKRGFDLIVALTGVILGMPLWLLIAALIKLSSRGPVFYKQPRLGLQGRLFGMYKFRSMVTEAEARLEQVREANHVADGPLFKLRQDPRVTPVGRWLRRFSVDEFPQLINVVRGDMSLVGPRPPLPDETLYYTDYDWRRLDVLPGMTGLWQVSGRSDLTFNEMVGLDLFYIGNWRLALDLSILARTVPAILSGRGAW